MLIFSPKLSGAEIAMLRLVKESSLNILVVCGSDNYDLVESYLGSKKIFVFSSILSLNRDSSPFLTTIIKLFKIIISINISLYQFIKKHNIEIVYSNNTTLSLYVIPLVSILFFSKSQIKFFWHEHTLYLEGKFMKFIEQIIYLFYNKTIVNSIAVKSNFHEKKTQLLYYGLNSNQFLEDKNIRKKVRKSLGITNEICIGIFGVISKNKGHHILLDAFNKINKKNNKVKLLIVGKAYNDDYLNSLVNQASDSVIFIDWSDDINQYYNTIDILVNASDSQYSEAFGLTIAEAMLFYKIVLCSNTGGIPEIVDDRINGFLFEPNNRNDLHEKLKYLVDNYSNLGNIRLNAHKSIVERFNMKKMQENFQRIICNENT